jgi:hypothetical protein
MIFVEAEWHRLMKEICNLELQPNTNGAASFGHITGGYSAGLLERKRETERKREREKERNLCLLFFLFSRNIFP